MVIVDSMEYKICIQDIESIRHISIRQKEFYITASTGIDLMGMKEFRKKDDMIELGIEISPPGNISCNELQSLIMIYNRGIEQSPKTGNPL